MKTILILLAAAAVILPAQYSYKISVAGSAAHAGESNRFTLSVYVADSTLAYSVERSLPYDVPAPGISLNSKTGMAALSYGFDGFVELYNSRGEKLWSRNFFKEMEPEYERTLSCRTGETGVFVLTSDIALPAAAVHAVALDGTPLWTTPLPRQSAYTLALSPDESIVAASAYDADGKIEHQTTTLLSSEGTAEGTIPILFRKAAFSDDRSLLALSSEREIVIVSLDTKKETARTGKRTGGIITDLCWNRNTLIVQEADVVTPANGDFYFQSPGVTIYSPALEEQSARSFPDRKYKRSELRVSDSGAEVIFDGISRETVVK